MSPQVYLRWIRWPTAGVVVLSMTAGNWLVDQYPHDRAINLALVLVPMLACAFFAAGLLLPARRLNRHLQARNAEALDLRHAVQAAEETAVAARDDAMAAAKIHGAGSTIAGHAADRLDKSTFDLALAVMVY